MPVMTVRGPIAPEEHGYDHLGTTLLPKLRKAGVREEQFQIIVVENSAPVLPF